MDWDKLRIFHAAAEAGSFTHAGEALRMSQSAVSRQVSALEKELDTALFHRHARGLALTEQGEVLYQTVVEIFAKLQTAELLLSDAATKPAGELKITAPIGLGTVWLTQRLDEFVELYPKIQIDLILSDEHIDLSMRAADVAIWTSEPHQAHLIRRSLFQMNVRAYASRSYIEKHGAPQSLEELDEHRIVSYSGPPTHHLSAITWIDTAGREGKTPRTSFFRVNSVVAMKYAVSSGIGIGMIPDYLADGNLDLVPVLTETDTPKLPILFVYPDELKNSKKVQVLRDFLVSKARKWKY